MKLPSTLLLNLFWQNMQQHFTKTCAVQTWGGVSKGMHVVASGGAQNFQRAETHWHIIPDLNFM